MPTHRPRGYAPNQQLRHAPFPLERPDGSFLDHAQLVDGALYTIHGTPFPDRVIGRMRPEDAALARRADPDGVWGEATRSARARCDAWVAEYTARAARHARRDGQP